MAYAQTMWNNGSTASSGRALLALVLVAPLWQCKDDPPSSGDETGTTTGTTSTDDGMDETTGPPQPCGNGMVEDDEVCDDGNKINADGCNNDCRPSMEVEWTEVFEGGPGADCAEAVATDAEGNVLVAGFIDVEDEGGNLWVRKYDPDGNELWTETSAGPAPGGDDRYRGLDVAPDGSLYVAGYVTSTDPLQVRNILVRKIDSSGQTVWTQFHNGPFDGQASASADDSAYGVAALASGGLVVVGEELAGEQNTNIWIRKYDDDGNEQWTVTHDGPAEANDSGRAIAEGPDGTLVITGWETDADGGRSIWVRKTTAEGAELWTQTFNAGSPNGNTGFGAAVLSTGEVAITGMQREGNGSTDMWTRLYSADGQELWTDVFASIEDGPDIGRAITVSTDDTIVSVGTFSQVGGAKNIRMVKYKPDGDTWWNEFYTGVSKIEADAFGVAVDPDDNIIFVGCQLEPGDITSLDIMVAKVSP